MAVRWYNPLTWRFFGYTDPQTGDYREVDMEVGGRKTKSGVRITAKTAITVPIVWTCVKILSESAAGLPLKLYQDVGGKRTLVRGDSAANKRALRLLGKPNPYITRLNLLKAVVVNMALRGNAYVIVERNRQGEMIGLIPVCADDVSIDTDDDLLYIVELKGQRIPVSPESMLHFKLFSTDGITGLSPLEYQAEAMGLAKAGQDWSARFMRKGGFTGGYVVYDQFLSKEQQGQIMEKFPDVRKGDVDDIGKIAVLQGGPKLIPAGLSQKDSQFIESQQFQEEALAGVWGVPLYLANRAGRTSILGSNLEQQNSGFVTYGLKPYLDAIEDEWNDKIHRGTEVFVEFVVEGLLRGDSAARSTYYKAALGGSGGSGWMSINDVRLKENLPRLEGAQYDAITQWESQGNDRQQN